VSDNTVEVIHSEYHHHTVKSCLKVSHSNEVSARKVGSSVLTPPNSTDHEICGKMGRSNHGKDVYNRYSHSLKIYHQVA
jgi:hypothetical protein